MGPEDMKSLRRKFAEDEVEFAVHDLPAHEALGVMTEVSARILAEHGITPGSAAYTRYLDLHHRMLPARVRRLHREAREGAH